ncbi:MAG: family 78 glycoside hydrolase catalytic domain, partial [Oscillospiraceae bacterium]
MQIVRMKTNRMVNPMGFALGTPTVSWNVIEAEGKTQKSAQVIVRKDFFDGEIVFDSGKQEKLSGIAYPLQFALKPRTRYYWQVTVFSDQDEVAVSDPVWFETGKQEEKFAGRYIKPNLPYDVCPYLRKSFQITGKILRARAYFTGLGVYELHMNGKKVGEEYLAPGCTAYDKWIQYQTYDVTDYILPGENVIGAILGNGWAKGRFGFGGKAGSFTENTKGTPSDIFTDEYLLLGDIIVETDEGIITVSTDDTWQSAQSPLTFSSIYDGERYDARKEIPSWSEAGGNDHHWETTSLTSPQNIKMPTARLSPPVKKMQEFQPTLIKTPKNELILDVGQEISGWIAFRADLPAGREVKLCYSEILQEDCFYRDNMRSALCEYRYISKGERAWVQPITTFFGFRYVKLEGFNEDVNAKDFTACAIYSDLETTGSISTGNKKVNRLFENCLWSQ